MRDSYIQQWNLNVQHKLPGNIVLDVGYVGQKGTRPDRDLSAISIARSRSWTRGRPASPRSTARRPDPLFPRAVTADKSIGNSIYHALQAKAERRMSQGLTFLTAYTWSKSISGPSDIGGQVGGGFYIGAPQDIYYICAATAPCRGFDVTQRFVQTAALRRAVLPQLARPAKIPARWLAALHHRDRPERLPHSGIFESSIPPAPASPPAPTWFPASAATCLPTSAPGRPGSILRPSPRPSSADSAPRLERTPSACPA